MEGVKDVELDVWVFEGGEVKSVVQNHRCHGETRDKSLAIARASRPNEAKVVHNMVVHSFSKVDHRNC